MSVSQLLYFRHLEIPPFLPFVKRHKGGEGAHSFSQYHWVFLPKDVVYETQDLIDKALIEGFGCANDPYKLLHDRRGRCVHAGPRVRLSMPVRDGFHHGGAGIGGLDVDDGRPQVFKEPFIPLFLRFKPGDKPGVIPIRFSRCRLLF
jgi:hypothetical protein